MPPSDPRLGKMNTARWLIAHKMMVSEKKKELKTWARFMGVDMDAHKDSEAKIDPEDTSSLIPFSALVAPDAYKAMREHVQTMGGGVPENNNLITDDVYEQQLRELESSNGLTEIDSILARADVQAQEKKRAAILASESEIARKQEEPVRQKPNKRNRRPRMISKK